MMYSVGDKVKIVDAMEPSWLGDEAEITGIVSENPICYTLNIGGGHWLHSSLEEIIEEELEPKVEGRLFLITFDDDDPIELFVKDDINRPNCPEAEEVMTAWVLDNIGYKSFKAYELGAFERFKV